MKRIEEHEIFAAVVSQPLNAGRLAQISEHNGKGYGDYADCQEYLVGDLDCLEESLIARFRITEALMDRWYYGGYLFRLHLFVRDGILFGGHIFKYRNTSMCCHFRPTGYATDPTQQEIRIAERILAYLTQNRDKETSLTA